MSDTTTYQIPISSFALITRLSPKALRMYDEKGLLVPSRDPFNNYRYYTPDQIERGLKIKMMTWLGFSLSDMARMLDALNEPRANAALLESMLKQRLAQTQLEIQRLKKVEEVLQGRNALEVFTTTTTQPEKKNVPAVRVLSRRGTGLPAQLIPELLGSIMQEIFKPDNQRGQVTIAGPPMLLFDQEAMMAGLEAQGIVNTSMAVETAMQKAKESAGQAMTMEVAVPVTGRLHVGELFDVKTLPAMNVISVLHTGPYSSVEGAYMLAFKHVHEHGLKMAGPCREIYLNNPQDVGPDELMTEVQVPVS